MGGRGSRSGGAGGFTSKLGNRMIITMANGDRSTFTYIGNGEIIGDSGDRYRISEVPGGISGMKKRAAKVEFLGPEKNAPRNFSEYGPDRSATRGARLSRKSRAKGARLFTR